MPARLLDSSLTRLNATTAHEKRPPANSDVGYEALSRLTELRDNLSSVSLLPHSQWKVPPLFFFDRGRESERRACSPAKERDPFETIAVKIAAELPALCRSVEVRRVARAIEGLRVAAEAIAPYSAAAKNLVEMLAIPDDEKILVLHPETRAGFRMTVRGIADVGQFHVLMAAAVLAENSIAFRDQQAIPDRLVAACRNTGPAIPAGIPMVMEALFQLYTPAAINPDGTLPTGFGGCDHWLWPASALASIPRVGEERVVLLGPPAYRAKWDVSVRFHEMPAELRMVETLSPFRVAEQLSKLTGNPIPPIHRYDRERKLLKAA